MSAPSLDSSADLQQPNTRRMLGLRIPDWLPNVLIVCLVAFHIMLATDDLAKRGFYPTAIHHDGYWEVINFSRYLDGFVPFGIDLDDATTESRQFIDGKRGPDIQWSDPRALWHVLTQGWLRGLWASDDYPTEVPLAYLLPAVVHKVSGGSLLATALTPQLFLAVMLFSVYGIGRRAGGPWIGVAAAVIAGGYPGVYLLARTHHHSLATGAMAAALICLLAYSRGFTRLWICALAGITAYVSTLVPESMAFVGLIGLIVAGPFAMEFVRLIRRSRSRPVDAIWGMIGLALFLAPACHLVDLTRFNTFINSGQNFLADMTANARIGSHVPESLHGILPFFAYFFNLSFDVGRPMMTLWLVAGAVLLWRAPRGERLSVALSVAVPLVLLSVMPKKGSWYITPLCPGFALITALGLRGLRSLKLRRWAMGLAVACGLLLPVLLALVPREYRSHAIMEEFWDQLKSTVQINSQQLGDDGGQPYVSHRTRVLPLAVACHELVAYDLRNNHGATRPRRVTIMGGTSHIIDGLRYIVELSHPEMFIVDLFTDMVTPDLRWQVLAELKADQFDYVMFIGGLEDNLRAFPLDDWDPLQWRSDFGPKPDEVVGDWTRSDQIKWNAGLRRFAKDLRKRRWKRIDLSVGPIYQAVNEGR